MDKEQISVSIKFPDKEKKDGLYVPCEWIAFYWLDSLKKEKQVYKDRCFDGTNFEVTVKYYESEGDA